VAATALPDRRPIVARLTDMVDRNALRDLAPVVVALVPFAAVLGVTIAGSRVVPAWAGILAAPLLFAGSAQLAALTLLDAGATGAAVLGAVLVINARLGFYGAALEPRFRDQPGWFRWLGPHFIVDQTFAAVTARRDLDDPRRFRRYWCTAGVLLGVVWTGAMGLAVVLGPRLTAADPLAFASTAVLVGLLVPRFRERRRAAAASIAAVVALVAAPLPHGVGLLVAVAAALIPSLSRRSGP
jgi:predicted branched-subunit amino acid permease